MDGYIQIFTPSIFKVIPECQICSTGIITPCHVTGTYCTDTGITISSCECLIVQVNIPFGNWCFSTSKACFHPSLDTPKDKFEKLVQ